MKKLILASAIAAIAANTATAATVYENKGLTYKIKGDWQVQLRDNASKTKDTEVEFDDLEIKNTITYDLGNDLQAFGQVDFGFKNEAEGKNTENLEEAYLGLKAHNVSVAVGKMDKAIDDFAIEGMIEEYTGESIFDATGSTDGDDVIRVDAEFDNVTLAVSHELEADGEGSDDGESTELFVSADLGVVTLGAGYQTLENTNTGDEEDKDLWGVSAQFDAGFAEFVVDYGEAENNLSANSDEEFFHIGASFKASATTKITIGHSELERDGASDKEQTYANVVYKFPAQKNVRLFAEISDVDEDGQDLDMDVLAGIRIKF
ncbi:porin [Neptuniibacter sp. QD34_54]|uniref:porin n=1 Tax=Neptuniibacter sp. QD34_54 TaxID=3398208 RepID=UPI0039F5A3DB